jgi:uncharacterized protein YjbJ (UPF0337 family)
VQVDLPASGGDGASNSRFYFALCAPPHGTHCQCNAQSTQRSEYVVPIETSISLKEIKMNWDRIEGNWKQFKGNVKEQWGKLTDDQLDVIAGKRDHLAGKIQETYGLSKDETEKQLSKWQKNVEESKH